MFVLSLLNLQIDARLRQTFAYMKKESNHLAEIARLFLRLGITAFGGPAAHIAMMQREVVDKNKWMTHEHFLDLIGATNLIPGPNSTEMAIHVGHEKGGLKGLVLAGICFIGPAVIITLFVAWLYKKFGKLPAMQAFLYGVKPAIIAVILAAIYPLLKKASKTKGLILLGMLSLLCCFLGVNEIYVILGAGLLYLLLSLPASGPARSLLSPSILQISYSAIFSAANMHLFWTFLKIGSILYGSGYVLFALLDAELVQKGLLSRQELIDAIAVGQFTPGPVFSAVTFIGYQINGFSGALFSTIAVFLPSFIFVWILNPLIPQMRRSVHFGNFLDAVNIASLAAILYVCYQMGVSSLQDWRSISIGLLAAALLFTRKNINSAWVILGGSLAGYLLLLI